MSQIGEPQRIIIAEPLYIPVPEKTPQDEPAVEPERKPGKVVEPEEVPA